MDWLSLSKYAFSLIFVLSLMGGLALVLRYLDQKSGSLNFLKNAASKRRIQVIEKLPVDRQKSALILRIDHKEYLVISGPNGETVLETKDSSDGNIVPYSKDQKDRLFAQDSAKTGTRTD